MDGPTATSALAGALAGLRIAVEAGAFASPALADTLFGVEPKRNPQSPYLRAPVRRPRRQRGLSATCEASPG
jgi:hypothetical protein